MTRTEISNSADVLDSRDIIARIEELEEERQTIVDEIAEAETKPVDSDGDEAIEEIDEQLQKVADLRSDLEQWDESEEAAELKALKALAEQCEGYGDWSDGEALIRESYFAEYCEQMVSDIGDMPREIPSYIVIDWEATANNIKADYMTVEFDGVEYLMRA